jgi:two-component system, OmpR family, response regulator
MRVLVIEDDRKVANFICTGLEQEGYAVDVLHEGAAAGAQALACDYDAVVLDLMLPGRSGFQVLRDIRARKAELPILILTAKDSLEERIAGLDSGADDYMVKPFAPEEMAARVRAICRRSGGSAGAHIRVGEVDVDLVARCAWLGDERIELTSREWSVLEALVLRPGRIVTKSELERLVLGFESELASNAIEVHVSSLRKKLGRELVETVRGMGYRVSTAS